MSFFSVFSGAVPAALQVAVMVILVRRRLYRRFPWFFAYITYSTTAELSVLWTINHPEIYFVLYWSNEIVYGILALLAILEVLGSLLEMYYSLYRWTRWLLPTTLTLIVGNSIWRALYHPMAPVAIARFATAAYAFVPGIFGLQAAAFLLCVKLSFRKYLPIRWSRYEAGILAGLGVVAIATVLADVTRSHFGPAFETFFRYAPSGACVAAGLGWLAAFWRKEPPLVRKPTDPELFKRAAAFMRQAADDTEKDLELRSYPLLNS